MSNISVLIITKDEEKNIGRAIMSVTGLDEVLVLDSGSSDDTPLIAERSGAKVIPTGWPGFSEQRRRAMKLAKNEWCLFLDADEELDKTLSESLMKFEPETGVSGYHLKRNNYFLGRQLNHGRWARDRQLRLFLRSQSSIADRQVHEGVDVNGRTKYWPDGSILHHTAPTLQKYLGKQNIYTSLEAGQKAAQGTRFSGVRLMASPAAEFIKLYLWQGGFRDGLRGFALASLSALYKFAVWAKMYQIQKKAGFRNGGEV